MVDFDAERYLRIQSGAVARFDDLRGLAAGGEWHRVVFAGAGGAGLLMRPAARLLAARSSLRVQVRPAAELALDGSGLAPDCLVVIPSLSGTTPESLVALERAKAAGATVAGLTAHGDSELAAKADATFVNFAEDDTSCESFYLQSTALALALADDRSGGPSFDEFAAGVAALPELLVDAKRAFEPRAEQLAEHLASHDYHLFVGAGGAWTQAFYYAMCILEEMQWIRTRPVEASDFFHGPLELVAPGVSLVLLKGEDELRPLADRVERFAAQYTDALQVIDTADCELRGVSPAVRALISPVVLAALLERVSAHLEVLRDHPLTTRRYYRRVAY